MTHAIDTHDLTKTFGRTVALNRLTLTVEPGEVHGFLGPNGAGKSTTIRILLGLLRATGGRARLFGQDPWRDAVDLHRQLAYVPGDVTLWPNLTGGEAIDLLTRLHGRHDPGRRADLLERFDLDPTKKGRSYSKGNRQKVALVAALTPVGKLEYMINIGTLSAFVLVSLAPVSRLLQLAAGGVVAGDARGATHGRRQASSCRTVQSARRHRALQPRPVPAPWSAGGRRRQRSSSWRRRRRPTRPASRRHRPP